MKIFTLSLMLLGVLGAAVQCDQAPPFNPEAPAVVALSKRGFAPPILDLGLGPANVASVWIGGEKATSSTQLSLRWDAAALRDDQMMAFASEGSLRVAPFRDVLLGSVSGTPQLQVDPAWIVAVEWSAAGAQVAVVTVTLLDGGRMGAYELLVLDEALQVVESRHQLVTRRPAHCRVSPGQHEQHSDPPDLVGRPRRIAGGYCQRWSCTLRH